MVGAAVLVFLLLRSGVELCSEPAMLKTTPKFDPEALEEEVGPRDLSRPPTLPESMNYAREQKRIHDNRTHIRRLTNAKNTYFNIPYLVNIETVYPTMGTYGCAGSIFSARFILTAAHCVTKRTESYEEYEEEMESGVPHNIVEHGKSIKVTFRDIDSTSGKDGSFERHVFFCGIHPTFSWETQIGFDVALCRLFGDGINLNLNQGLAAISPPGKNSIVGEWVLLAGWGALADHDQGEEIPYPRLLQHQWVKVPEQSKCEMWHNSPTATLYRKIKKTEFCVVGRNEYTGEDVTICDADSGGPAVQFQKLKNGTIIFRQYGIASYSACSWRSVFLDVRWVWDWLQKFHDEYYYFTGEG